MHQIFRQASHSLRLHQPSLALPLAFFALLFFVGFVEAASMIVPAIDAKGSGIATTIEARATPGKGDVYVAIEPLVSVETQFSERVAAKIAAELAGVNRSAYDVLFKIVAPAEVVDGPSGGLAMTLLAYSELSKKPLRRDLSATGTIELGGGIGKVGGILAKAEVVAQQGLKVFLIPSGQGLQDGIDVTDYALTKWGLQVIEVANAREAVAIATTPEGSVIEAPKRVAKPLEINATKPVLSAAFKQVAEQEVDALEGAINASGAPQRILNASKESLNLTRLLFEKGYLYSAANAAFVNRIVLEAIAYANITRTQLQQKLLELRSELEGFLAPVKTLEGFEWSASGELRFVWALLNLRDIEERLPLVKEPSLLVRDYLAARHWLRAAKALSKLSAGNKSFSEGVARAAAEEALIEARRALKEAPSSEAAFHLEAAEEAFKKGFYIASLLDTQYVIAFTSALRDAEERTAAELLAMLNESANFSSSAWAELFFAHSLYQIAEWRRSENIAHLINALQLQRLAQRFEDAINAVKRLAVAAPIVQVVTPSPTLIATPAATPAATPIATPIAMPTLTPMEAIVAVAVPGVAFDRLLGLLMIVAIIALLLLLFFFATRPRAELRPREALERADRALLEGRISERTWQYFHKKYGERRS